VIFLIVLKHTAVDLLAQVTAVVYARITLIHRLLSRLGKVGSKTIIEFIVLQVSFFMKSFVQISSCIAFIQKNLTSEIACKLRTGGPVLYPGFYFSRDRTPALAGGTVLTHGVSMPGKNGGNLLL
jgi:hypothetical protein